MRKVILLAITVIFLGSCQKDEIQEPLFLTNAGNDFLHIEEFEVGLNADTLQRGIWTIHSGLVDEKVFFEDDKNPKTIFHGLPDEEYKLVWSVKNAGKTATDTIAVTFAPLNVEITNVSPDFYKTRLDLLTNKYDKGIWTVEGNFHHIQRKYAGGTIIPDEESPYIIFYGFENTSYKLTWTTWYGSKSASATIEFNAGNYQQDEALEDLSAREWNYKKDENGNVVEIDLGGDWNGWKFSKIDFFPALQSLVYLKKLSLDGDNLHVFPEVIASKYINLEVLDISWNAISSLPENIGNLTKLDTLLMEHNQDNQKLTSLPESFGSLNKLRYLDLSSMGIKNLPESFGNLTSLNHLNLESNYIIKLPDNFGDLKSLETFRGPSLEQNIPSSFSNLENLKFCFFRVYADNAFLPNDFGKLSNLETLWIHAKYTDLPNSFCNLGNLKDLKIIGGSIIDQLPDNFGDLTNLENLRIAGSFKTLPSSFSNLTKLKNLTIHGTLEYLPFDIGSLKKLEGLSLNGMNLKEIPESFGDLENLKYFSAYDNYILSIPESFGNLQKIYSIDLSYNNISKFPSTMGNLSETLDELIIRGNNYSKAELNSLEEMLPSTDIITN